jgi:hypothetical protein
MAFAVRFVRLEQTGLPQHPMPQRSSSRNVLYYLFSDTGFPLQVIRWTNKLSNVNPL